MLKKILVSQLRVGMYVHEIDGSWLDHSFWRKTFLLDNPADLAKLQDSNAAGVVIDTSKGLDVACAQPAVAAPVQQAPVKPAAPKKVSAESEHDAATRIIDASRAAITSMFHEARMGNAVHMEDALPLVEDIAASVARNSGTLIGLARLKTVDDYTYMHSVAVCALMIALARQLDMNEEDIRQAGLAGLLHDIGKTAIPLELLQRAGKLSGAEFDLVKNHPVAGHEMLQKMAGVEQATLDVALHHHERVDGAGYPHGLTSDSMSIFAKMGAVCDVYDAITSNRPYKAGWEPGHSLKRMAEWTGHFEPHIFHAFIKSVGIFPIGALVLLESGRLAVVIDHNDGAPLSPRVKAFFSTKSTARIPEQVIDLSKSYAHDRIVSHEDPVKWRIQHFNEIWT